MLFQGGFSFANFLTDVLAVFLFVVWFWLLVLIYADLFQRHDISGSGKALWVIVLLLFFYIGRSQTPSREEVDGGAERQEFSRLAMSCVVLLASAPPTRSGNSISLKSQGRSLVGNTRVCARSWFHSAMTDRQNLSDTLSGGRYKGTIELP